MKNEPVLSVLSRIAREGLQPDADPFDRDLHDLYTATPEKYIALLVQQERDEKEEKLTRQVAELRAEVKRVEKLRKELSDANLLILEKLGEMDAEDKGTDRAMGLLRSLLGGGDEAAGQESRQAFEGGGEPTLGDDDE